MGGLSSRELSSRELSSRGKSRSVSKSLGSSSKGKSSSALRSSGLSSRDKNRLGSSSSGSSSRDWRSRGGSSSCSSSSRVPAAAQAAPISALSSELDTRLRSRFLAPSWRSTTLARSKALNLKNPAPDNITNVFLFSPAGTKIGITKCYHCIFHRCYHCQHCF